MIIYNGYKDGESRTAKHRVSRSDGGHSLVSTTTTRRGSAFAFTYRVTCQCGQTYSSRQTPDRAWRSHEAHRRSQVSA